MLAILVVGLVVDFVLSGLPECRGSDTVAAACAMTVRNPLF